MPYFVFMITCILYVPDDGRGCVVLLIIIIFLYKIKIFSLKTFKKQNWCLSFKQIFTLRTYHNDETYRGN